MSPKVPPKLKTARPAIAIVGMACEFPGAHSPEELWENILAGRRYFRKSPHERLPSEYFDTDPTAQDKAYCDRMAVIDGWQFDPLKFHVPPITFHASDITHWLALHVADAAVRDSGVDFASVDRTRAAVILGNTLTGEFNRSHYLRLRWPYVERALLKALSASGVGHTAAAQIAAAFNDTYNAPLPEASEDSLAGNMANTIAGRISNHFNLGGGSFTVDGACSSSILSLTIACDALVGGRLDMALAGGVDVSLDPFEIIGFAKAQALAHEDIRPYDERANGMLTGEGCGIFVLMREDDARARKLRVHALLKGWAFSSDGKGAITAPEVEGQCRALRRAYETAGYPITSVRLFEGHGTGTPLGDRVELTALQKVLQEAGDEGDHLIGSLKASIGHCKAAAGAAAVVKVVQALKHRILPATVNCDRPHPLFAQSGWKLRPSLKGVTWSANGKPRRASVSAMGFGGANSHVTLEETEPALEQNSDELSPTDSRQASELIVLSASDLPGLRSEVDRLKGIARRICHAELTDLSAALVRRPPAGDLRLALVVSTPWELAERLDGLEGRLQEDTDITGLDDPSCGVYVGRITPHPQLAALFPGQGSQRLNMGERFRDRFPFVRELLAAFDEDAAREGAPALAPVVYRDVLGAPKESVERWEAELRDTRVAQPAIVANSMATLAVLEFFGLRPTIVIGHSLGEISALAAGGAWDAKTAVRLAGQRGNAMGSLNTPDPGGMVALAAPPEEVGKLVDQIGPDLVISNYNSLRQTVASGTTPAVQELLRLSGQRGIRVRLLPVSHAFHSDIVAPAAHEFRRAIQAEHAHGPSTLGATVISSSTGEAVTSGAELAALLGDQIRRPVVFTQAVRAAATHNPALWVEVGPGNVLTDFVRNILGASNPVCLPTDVPGDDAFDLLNRVLAKAYVIGFALRLENLFAHRFHRVFDVDNYNPVFLVNPCERPVELPDIPKVNLAEGGIAESAFLREFVDLYQRHHSGKSVTRNPQTGAEWTAMTPTAKESGVAPGIEGRSSTLLDFAIRWIAKRTGFPADKITADQKLRDDLGLDSIKAGELVLNLSRELKRPFAGDPAIFANSSLSDIVKELEAAPADSTHDETRSGRIDPVGDVLSLDQWIRSFRMAPVGYPITEEQPQAFPHTGRFFVFAHEERPSAMALSHALTQRGLKVTTTTPDSLATLGDPPTDMVGMAVFLPTEEKTFYSCSPTEFSQRVEGFSERLFRLFRWFGHGRPADWSSLRAIVVHSVSSPNVTSDLDAGAAFLKSIRLEYSGASPKWISLPREWEAQRIADTLVAELETTSERVRCYYATDGQRFTEVALPLDQPAHQPLPLGPEDVVVVTGGAKGITAELALGLAKHTQAKVALLGSSPAPAPDAKAEENEITKSLKRFAEAGLICGYYQCDVTDGVAVQSAVARVEKDLGSVTGILHGAGISKLQRFAEKPLEEFLDCVRVKATGLYYILQCVSLSRLKMLHAVSSVLGKTGMRGQTDYTFANAWLDGAVRSVKSAYPHIHCLTLGYSVWGETGLGKRLGALDYLVSMGVRPITTEEGVAEYVELFKHADSGPVFVTTGNLPTPLEGNLYSTSRTVEGRFLERLRRWVPRTELCADATLSHQTDLFLAEHVYYGTPLFPGVMAIEAMMQAANACLETDELPVLRDIEFRRPLVIHEDESVVIRVLALADKRQHGMRRVRVAIRADRDHFSTDHFAAECWYGSPEPPAKSLPTMPLLPDALPINPEELHPEPLFQGKLFRRIQKILVRSQQKESLTQIEWPQDEQYFATDRAARVLSASPAVRDACLQSGAIAAPPGCLPERIAELRFYSHDESPRSLFCHSVLKSPSADKLVAEYVLFSESGRVLEQVSGLVLGLPQSPPPPPPKPAKAIPLDRLAPDLAELLPDFPHALVLVAHDNLDKQPELNDGASVQIRDSVSPARQTAALGNLVAARRAIAQFAFKHHNVSVIPGQVQIQNRTDGKPELRFVDQALEKVFTGVDVSLADGGGYSVAFVGPGSVGVDIEPVEVRNAELWHSLLGTDGYALALALAKFAHERFDVSASRVWSMLEAGKKADGSKRFLPVNPASLGATWISLESKSVARRMEVVSAFGDADRSEFCVAFVYLQPCKPSGPATESAGRNDAMAERSAHGILRRFAAGLEELQLAAADDPNSPRCEHNYERLHQNTNATARLLEDASKELEPEDVRAVRQSMYTTIRQFLAGSESCLRCLTKPLGYPGDYVLMEQILAEENRSRGLAYHCDRFFLSQPGCEAIRKRTSWATHEIELLLKQDEPETIRILDLGCGPMAIENELQKSLASDTIVEFQGVDNDMAALRFAASRLRHSNLRISTNQMNLLSEAGIAQLRALAGNSDIVVSMGLIEYFSDETVLLLLSTLSRAMRAGSRLLLGNYQPDHPSRAVMEWCLDWWLVYRTEAHLRSLLEQATFERHKIHTELDATGSVVLATITR